MKSTKTMLLGCIIALLGVGLAQPGNNYYLFRTFYLIPTEVITIYCPLASILFILAGVIVGVVGYLQKQ